VTTGSDGLGPGCEHVTTEQLGRRSGVNGRHPVVGRGDVGGVPVAVAERQSL
jgi:hypothetical protein